MKLEFQENSISELHYYRDKDEHSLLIAGSQGSGKTYLSKEYYKILGCDDFIVVNPTVKDIRDVIDSVYRLDSKILVCIENLDTGVKAASYAMLKFLEEPRPNVYVVVTCRNLYEVPDTILSRSKHIILGHPVDEDLSQYARVKDHIKFDRLKSSSIWKAVKTFNDIDYLFNLSYDQITYIESLRDTSVFKKPVLDVSWKLGHFEDNTELNVPFLLRYMLAISSDSNIRKKILNCLFELEQFPIAEHAILCKFIIEMKYGE